MSKKILEIAEEEGYTDPKDVIVFADGYIRGARDVQERMLDSVSEPEFDYPAKSEDE